MILKRRTILQVALAGLAVSVLHNCLWSAPGNADLQKRSIPTIPGSFKVLGSSHGGLFAKWFFLAVRLDPETYDQYRQLIADDSDTGLTIGKEVLIRKVENISAEDRENGHKLDLISPVNGSYLRWWDVDKIVQGTLYQKELPDACNYKIFFDDWRKQVYIQWHYS